MGKRQNSIGALNLVLAFPGPQVCSVSCFYALIGFNWECILEFTLLYRDLNQVAVRDLDAPDGLRLQDNASGVQESFTSGNILFVPVASRVKNLQFYYSSSRTGRKIYEHVLDKDWHQHDKKGCFHSIIDMKILIVYDSKYGNNRQIANLIAETLQKAAHEVKVNYAKDLSPKAALAFQPEIFLFGGPIRAGMVSFTIKRWVSRFSGRLTKSGIKLTKAAVWATHGVNAPDTPERFSWKNTVTKWEKLFAKVPAAKTLPGVTDVSVEGMEGPMESGWQAKITGLVERLLTL